MAKVTMTKATRWNRQATDYIRARIHTNAECEALADYLHMSVDSVRKRNQGNVPWRFEEMMNALEFYGTEPAEVLR